MDSFAPSIFEHTPAHPAHAIHAWLAFARAEAVIEPTAVALATASSGGIASNRIVQILDVSAEGLVFATHASSPKGMDIAATGWGSCVFHWPQVKRQFIVAGAIVPLSSERSDALWVGRSAMSHAMSHASTQSAPLEDEEALRAHAKAAAERGELARPDKWIGFVLQLHVVEFWQFATDRLYKRLQYRLLDGRWSSRRLQP